MKTKTENPSPKMRDGKEPSSPILCKVVTASMTLEASIVLPICVFFMINLGTAVEMMRFHNNMQMAITEVGRNVALYGYDLGNSETIPDEILLQTYVRSMTLSYLGTDYVQQFPIVGGTSGIRFWESNLANDDEILEIIVTYAFEPIIAIAGFTRFYMSNHMYIHKWTGWDNGSEQAGDYVYVAETGTVWHSSAKCSYLFIRVEAVLQESIGFQRNHSGERYLACSRCAKGEKPGVVYVTSEGNRYHYDKNCSTLQRTVTRISKDEAIAGNLNMCSRCAKREGKEGP